VTYPRSAPQDWAPELLTALIAGEPITGPLTLYQSWAQSDFAPAAYLDSGESSNWQHMIGACRLWMDAASPVDGSGLPFSAGTILEWWLGLLQVQAGAIATETMFQYFGLSEPLSAIYEQMRWGSVLAVRLLALRQPDLPSASDLLDATARYSEVLCGLLALGGARWTAQAALCDSQPSQGFSGAGGPWYDGPTFSPVSERSEAMGLQTDLGPLWCMATGWELSVSRREQWAAGIGRQVLAADPGGRFGSGPGFGAASDLVQGASAGTLAAVVENLAGIRLWAPLHWLTWPQDGLLVYKESCQNVNTPCIFWSWSDDGQQSINLGWPWPPGRNREHLVPSQCSIQGSVITATVQEDRSVPASLQLPSGSASFAVSGGPTGISQVTPP